MKKIIKNLFILSIVVILPMILVGCNPKVNADESAKIWFNYLLKGDTTSVAKIGITEDAAKKLNQKQKVDYKKAVKDAYATGALKIEDKQLEQLYQAYKAALNKVSVTTEVISKTSELSEVKVKETYITSIDSDSKKTTADSAKYMDSLDVTNADKFNTEMGRYIIDGSIKAFTNAKISVATKEKTFKFVIKDKRWVPEDVSGYSEYIFTTALGK